MALTITHAHRISTLVTEPFGGLLASFQLALEAEGKSPKTLDNYSRAVVQFADWLRSQKLRDDDVTTVTAADVRGWLVSLQGKVAPSTEVRNYSGLRQFLGWCVREDELDTSPMVNIKPPKVPEPRTEMLTNEQTKALLAECAGKEFTSRRDTAIILLLADTGMRRSELANLATEDLDLRGRVVAVEGKGDASHRKPGKPSVTDSSPRHGNDSVTCRPTSWPTEPSICGARSTPGWRSRVPGLVGLGRPVRHDRPPGRSSTGEVRSRAVTPGPGNVDHLTQGLDAVKVTDLTSETVYVVHVHSGVLGWRRLYITEDSAWRYADRMQRRGHQSEVTRAVLIGGAS